MKTIVWLELHDEKVRSLEDSVCPEGFRILRPEHRNDREERLNLMAQADYLIAGSIPVTREEIEAAPHLKMIQKWGIGCDKIDCMSARERGISVYITAGANAVPVAELAVGLMFAVNRKIPSADKAMRQGKWMKPDMRAQCRMIHGKTVGLLGIGNIAREVAKMLRGFEDTPVIYFDKKPLPKVREQELGVSGVPFEKLLEESDILSIHIPLSDSTYHLIGERELMKMKSSAVLINTARGGVVDEQALIRALKDGTIRAAGLDCFEMEPLENENELLKLDQVVLTCHCGGGVMDNVLNVTRHAFDNILKYDSGYLPEEADLFA